MNGFQFFNESGDETVNSNDPALIIIASGKNGTKLTSIPWRAWPEPPTIFIRPTPGRFIGGFSIHKSTLNSNAVVDLGDGFDWVACCSSSNPSISARGTFGLETFDANGNLVFSAANTFVRLTKIVSVPGPYSDYRGNIVPQTATLSGLSKMPWVNIRDACLSWPQSHADYGSWPESFLFSINSSFTALTVTLGDNVSDNNNQYRNKLMYFPMGYIDSPEFI